MVCPEGSTCTGRWQGVGGCVQISVGLEDGEYVVQCGWHLEQRIGETTTRSGGAWGRVTFFLPAS